LCLKGEARLALDNLNRWRDIPFIKNDAFDIAQAGLDHRNVLRFLAQINNIARQANGITLKSGVHLVKHQSRTGDFHFNTKQRVE
jgi:hypothetical protein